MREKLSVLYTPENLDRQVARYEAVVATFEKKFGTAPTHLFSAPGRSEICGNHTDHNMGKVMAAAIDLDIAAAVAPREDDKIVLASDVFSTCEIDIGELEVREGDMGTSAAIVRVLPPKCRKRDIRSADFRCMRSATC